MTQDRDWRLPVNRREAFQRFYEFHLAYQAHPGAVYHLLPGIAQALELDDEQKAWLVWLNGNTQNVVTSLLLLQAAPRPEQWRKAVAFWNDHFTRLEWDTDRRHQKSKFGLATQQWVERCPDPVEEWLLVGSSGWADTWDYAFGQPYMGRLSSWSMIEYARILFGSTAIPDAATLMLNDRSGSRSHRNGLAVISGFEGAEYWDGDIPDTLGITENLVKLGWDLYHEALRRADGTSWMQDVSLLTLESALCTYKSWHKPNRRYPNVYNDMMYQRIKKAEARFPEPLQRNQFGLLWDIRREVLPLELRLEDNPYDPGLSPVKQNHYRETGEIPMLCHLFKDMGLSWFDYNVINQKYGLRKDPKWTTS